MTAIGTEFAMYNPSLITIGFSSHRIEMISFAKRLMKEHDVIITEEALESVSGFLEIMKDYLKITDGSGTSRNPDHIFPLYIYNRLL